MSTLGPTIDVNGIAIPDFADVFAQLQSQYKTIYGADADLDPDTQDGQFLAIFANAINDNNNATVDTFNSFSLNSAQGAGLSSIVKLTGTRRAPAGHSTDTVTIVGTVGTPINNGQVGDDLGQGTIWNLPASVVIPNTGTIDVTVTAAAEGATTFAPGQLTVILTPTQGWASVTNIGPETAGAPVQTDAQLRQLASDSVAGPANTNLESITAAVANTANVTRSFIYENDTDVNDTNGQGPHSIYAVVQGGAIQDIVNSIGSTKSPGTSTLGTTSGTFVDSKGVPNVIRYYQLALVTITVVVTVDRLTGWTNNTADFIKQAIAHYLSNLEIGEDSYLSRLYAPAGLKGDDAIAGTGLSQAQLDVFANTYNITSILQSRPSDAPPAVQDVPIAFNEATTCVVANITVNAI